MAIILVTGGARSGKSARAEARTLSFPGKPVYIATAEALDAEMRERIAKHRTRRGDGWLERETPLALVTAYPRESSELSAAKRSSAPNACAPLPS